MKDERKLELVLALLREALERPSGMTKREISDARKFERLAADRVMFNAGFHKAKSSGMDDELVGSYSAEILLPMLINYTEWVQAMSKAPEAPKRPGRKKGSYKEWHYAPGYQVVMAWDELAKGGKSLRGRIRKAVKDGWLEDIDDKTHERRIGLIRKRLDEEEDEHLRSIAPNAVRLRARKKRQ